MRKKLHQAGKFLIVFSLCCSMMPVFAQVTIDSTSWITVKPGTGFFVGTDLNIRAGAGGSGHFCDQNPGGCSTITGQVKVERYLSANGWHNVASPISNATSNVFGGTDLVFYYDETIIMNDWEFGWVFYDGPLSVMRGFDVYPDGTPAMVVYDGGAAGALNNGPYTIGVTRTNVPNGEIESHKGWNLVGNPYPSPVDWLAENGWDKSDINDAKYIWNPERGNYTIFLGGNNPVGINGATRYIPANQGFWVQALQDGSLQVNNAARCGTMVNTPGFYKSGDYPVVFLKVEGHGFSDETLIRFLPEAKEGFDRGLDAVKIPGRESSVPQINSRTESLRLAMNALPRISDGLAVDLDVRCGSPGNLSISLEPESSLPDEVELYLRDLKNGNLIHLTNHPEYSFYYDVFDDPGRFVLYFNPDQDIKNNIVDENAFSVYVNHDQLYVIKNTVRDIEGAVILYDIFGRTISRYKLLNQHENCYDVMVSAGYYLLRISSANLNITKKIGMGKTSY